MQTAAVEQTRYGLDLDHPAILRAILARIVETGDVIGRAGPRRTVLAVTLDDWLLDELAAVGAGGEGPDAGGHPPPVDGSSAGDRRGPPPGARRGRRPGR
jgi:hypothetical protein